MMRLLIVLVSTWALATAKPETYKEKEDFQFSRSSSDEGSKSGYYGAQRGNMGGNYERAHNMDSLAQHQMSTLVKQVDGELGSGADMRTGSVYTSGLSKGLFGSGNYDLSNLQGRNFNEGNTLGNSESYSSMQSNSGYRGFKANNARFSSSQSQNARQSSGFRSSGQSASDLLVDNQQAQNLHGGLEREYTNQASNQAVNNYRYYSHANDQRNSAYEANIENLQSNSDLNTQSRIISETPRKIYIRPGTKVTIPIAAQTYDTSHFNALQNSVNSDAEVLSNSGSRQIVFNKPVTKHYESSYNYRKEWEKHDTQPMALPTDNPFQKNREIYDNTQISDSNFQENLDLNNAQSRKTDSDYTSRYSSGSNSASSQQSKYQSEYTSDLQNLASSAGSHSADFMQGSHVASDASNIGSMTDDISSRPKSYHSSYSYHKSWERQGDPYVIKPISSDAETLQRLTAGSGNYGQYVYGKSEHSFSKCSNECVKNGHLRVARSYKTDQYDNLPQHQYDQKNVEQQSQNEWENTEVLGQQTQDNWASFSDLGQQTQNTWDNLENLGQQTQDNWDMVNKDGQQQHTTLELEELEQGSQNTSDKLHDLGQLPSKFEDFGQQRENKQKSDQQRPSTWDKQEDLKLNLQPQANDNSNLEQQIQSVHNKVEELEQRSQNTWDKLDLGQQSQNTWGNLEDLGQQSQNTWGKLEDLGQQSQNTWGNLENLGQQSQNTWGKVDDLGQQTQNTWGNLENLGQQSQNTWGKVEDLGQQTQNTWGNLENLGQQSQNTWGKVEDLGQQSQNTWGNLEDLGQQIQNTRDKLENLGQESENSWDKLKNLGQQTPNQWNNLYSPHSFTNSYQETQNQLYNSHKVNQALQNYWTTSQHEQTQNLGHVSHQDKIKLDQQDQEISMYQNHKHDSSYFFDKKEHTDNYGTFWQNENSHQVHSSNKNIEETAIHNLWDKLDKISKDLPSQNEMFGNRENYRNQLDKTNFYNYEKGIELTTNINVETTTKKELLDTFNINNNHKVQPLETGRGDISSEDNLTTLQPKIIDENKKILTESAKNKTPAQMKPQSLTNKGNDLDQHKEFNYGDLGDLNVLGLQKKISPKHELEIDSTTTTMHPELYTYKHNLENSGQRSMTSEDFGQQSVDQQFEDLSQLNHHIQSQTTQQSKYNLEDFKNHNQDANYPHHFENIGQEQQNTWSPEENMKQLLNSNEKIHEEYKQTNYLMNKDNLNNEKVESMNSAYNNTNIAEVPEELTTQKSGFWKSVGTKFNSAKDSVVSWFRKN